jgi:hypothetical protein
MCERRYRLGEQWYNVRPDARASCRIGSQHVRFWLEWDRWTMHARELLVKFSSYTSYIASRQWARACSMLPALACIAPDIAQERRRWSNAWQKPAWIGADRRSTVPIGVVGGSSMLLCSGMCTVGSSCLISDEDMLVDCQSSIRSDLHTGPWSAF